MMQKFVRVAFVLLTISGLALLAGWLWGPAASGAVAVIAGIVLGMFYVPSWGYGQPSEHDRVRERLIQNMKSAAPKEDDEFDHQNPT